MAASIASRLHQRTAETSRIARWAVGFERLFARIVVFRIDGTTARVDTVLGASAHRVGVSLSLVEQGPLRWAIEAASPVLNTGRCPGSETFFERLQLSPPRAFAVIPLLFDGRIAALVYADQDQEPMSLAKAAEVLRYCGEVIERSAPPGSRTAALLRRRPQPRKRQGRQPRPTAGRYPTAAADEDSPRDRHGGPESPSPDPVRVVEPEREPPDRPAFGDATAAFTDFSTADADRDESTQRESSEVARLQELAVELSELTRDVDQLVRTGALPGPAPEPFPGLPDVIATSLQPAPARQVDDRESASASVEADAGPLPSPFEVTRSVPAARVDEAEPVAPRVDAELAPRLESSEVARPVSATRVDEAAPALARVDAEASRRPESSEVARPLPAARVDEAEPVAPRVDADARPLPSRSEVVPSAPLPDELQPPQPEAASGAAPGELRQPRRDGPWPTVVRSRGGDEDLGRELPPAPPERSGFTELLTGYAEEPPQDTRSRSLPSLRSVPSQVGAQAPAAEVNVGSPVARPGRVVGAPGYHRPADAPRPARGAPEGVSAQPGSGLGLRAREGAATSAGPGTAEAGRHPSAVLGLVTPTGVVPAKTERREVRLALGAGLRAVGHAGDVVWRVVTGRAATVATPTATSTRRSTWRRVAGVGMVLLLCGGGIAALQLGPVFDRPEGPHLFDVPRSASANAIAAKLQREGFVRNAVAVLGLARLMGIDRTLRAGRYRLPGRAWAWTVLRELHAGQIRTEVVTLPEGLTLAEVARTLEATHLGSADALMAAARDPGLLRKYRIPGRSLEGYLFPETYTLARGLEPAQVLEPMVRQFFQRIRRVPAMAELPPRKLFEKVTLASLVEREAKKPDEMYRVAGVFANRLARNMRLESCATVQYVLGTPKRRLRLADVRTRSPYNTYLRPGLPPGPIGNPGIGALNAAMAPERHDLLFFFALDDGSQRHVFSRTFAEHKRAQRVHRRGR